MQNKDWDSAFQGAILTNPEDPVNYLAYADWFDERNQDDDADIAFCLRWMVKNGKRPFHRLQYKDGRSVPEAYCWGWYRMTGPTHRSRPSLNPDPPNHAWIPRTIFAEISRGPHFYGWGWFQMVYRLAEALAQVRKDISL